MIYEIRTYRCKPGTVQRQIAFYRDHGLAIQTRHLGAPLVFGATEFGDVNSYVHVWAFADFADRNARRGAMMADPEWRDFLGMSAERDDVLSQENTVLKGADFMPQAGQ
ncbi:NIPSNAP family protein [Marinovum sp.]|uniref:NIPSNAP family protein n=1 Tax=Marinovum sp. TaxID=2024839 RepID=UPI002B273BE0|nr:NIPSNAP family protein [Marinovum sp.]